MIVGCLDCNLDEIDCDEIVGCLDCDLQSTDIHLSRLTSHVSRF